MLLKRISSQYSFIRLQLDMIPKHEKKVFGKKMLEVKLDGVRVITIVRTDGNVEQFLRNGKQFITLDTS